MHKQGHWTCSICLAWVSLSMRILLWLALRSPLAPGSSSPMEQPTPCRQLVLSQVLNCTMKPGSWAGQDFAVQLDHHGPWPKIPLALGSSATFLPVQVQGSSLLHSISQVLSDVLSSVRPIKVWVKCRSMENPVSHWHVHSKEWYYSTNIVHSIITTKKTENA